MVFSTRPCEYERPNLAVKCCSIYRAGGQDHHRILIVEMHCVFLSALDDATSSFGTQLQSPSVHCAHDPSKTQAVDAASAFS